MANRGRFTDEDDWYLQQLKSNAYWTRPENTPCNKDIHILVKYAFADLACSIEGNIGNKFSRARLSHNLKNYRSPFGDMYECRYRELGLWYRKRCLENEGFDSQAATRARHQFKNFVRRCERCREYPGALLVGSWDNESSAKDQLRIHVREHGGGLYSDQDPDSDTEDMHWTKPYGRNTRSTALDDDDELFTDRESSLDRLRIVDRGSSQDQRHKSPAQVKVRSRRDSFDQPLWTDDTETSGADLYYPTDARSSHSQSRHNQYPTRHTYTPEPQLEYPAPVMNDSGRPLYAWPSTMGATDSSRRSYHASALVAYSNGRESYSQPSVTTTRNASKTRVGSSAVVEYKGSGQGEKRRKSERTTRSSS